MRSFRTDLRIADRRMHKTRDELPLVFFLSLPLSSPSNALNESICRTLPSFHLLLCSVHPPFKSHLQNLSLSLSLSPLLTALFSIPTSLALTPFPSLALSLSLSLFLTRSASSSLPQLTHFLPIASSLSYPAPPCLYPSFPTRIAGRIKTQRDQRPPRRGQR